MLKVTRWVLAAGCAVAGIILAVTSRAVPRVGRCTRGHTYEYRRVGAGRAGLSAPASVSGTSPSLTPLQCLYAPYSRAVGASREAQPAPQLVPQLVRLQD